MCSAHWNSVSFSIYQGYARHYQPNRKNPQVSASIPPPNFAASRSFLYVPGDRLDMLSKSTGRGADAVIVDLEDGVAAGSKDQAREIVGSWLSEQTRDGAAALWVRVNSQPDLSRHDLEVVVQPALTGVYIPKVSAPSDVETVAVWLDELEASSNLRPGRVRIAPLLETAAGVLAAQAIATAPRVSHLAIGEADLAADLRMRPSLDGREMNSIRIAIVLASAAVRLGPPIGPVLTSFRDLDLLRTTSEELRRMGYGGRAAIHPDQVPIINGTFSPSEAELTIARDAVGRFEAAHAAGSAITVAEDGSLIDEAVVRLARITLSYRNSIAAEE
ncbi:MAG: CoA ester lyase [Acidimicrobiia bacterium]